MNKRILNKIYLTFGFLFLYKILTYVSVPGVDLNLIKSFFEDNSNNALGMYNMFNGNSIERMSIVSLGIMPYITASIFMELLSAASQKIKDIKKEKNGMQKYTQWTKYLTIFITIFQSIGVSLVLSNLTDKSGNNAILINTDLFIIMSMLSLVVGTMILLWIGEQITQRGFGNGISLIIVSGIVSSIPNAITHTIQLVNNGTINFIFVLFSIIIIIATITFIVYVEFAERRIPVSYMKNNIKISSYLPIKVNPAGVIPAIFASTFLMMPMTFFSQSNNKVLLAISDFLSPQNYYFNIFMFIGIMLFAFFYSSLTFKSKEMSENLKQQNGFLEGFRSGEETEKYLKNIGKRMTLLGALYLGLIATLPTIIIKSFDIPFYFGGISVLIVVQVGANTIKKFKSELEISQYSKNINTKF